MLRHVYGTNYPLIFASFIRYSLPSLSLITHSSLWSLLSSSLTHSNLRSELETCLFGKSPSSIDLPSPTGLTPRTLEPFNVFILLNGWILFVWCVRLSRLLVGFLVHLKSVHSHSFIHIPVLINSLQILH